MIKEGIPFDTPDENGNTVLVRSHTLEIEVLIIYSLSQHWAAYRFLCI
jgi:hypothetical protein